MTRPFSQETLAYMVARYPIVYLKPNDLQRSRGVLRLDRYRVSTKFTSYKHANSAATYRRVKRLKLPRSYVVQQGIKSVTKYQQPFDIRVHIVRVQGTWYTVGAVVRIAPKGMITTDCDRSTAHTVTDLCRNYLGYTIFQTRSIRRSLVKIATRVGMLMTRRRPRHTEYGIDVGIDSHRHLWIYEVNSLPAAVVLRSLSENLYYRLLAMRRQAS
jgi:hypothetical protein